MSGINRLDGCVRIAASRGEMVPGFNVFGYEDALAVVRAASRAGSPVLLMVNRDARHVLAVEHWGALLRSIAERASVPVGVHLDHCDHPETVRRAITSGFTSVMFDGSALALEENIAVTRDIAAYAHRLGVAVEAEVGAVPYDDLGQTRARPTVPGEAARMAEESGADWLAVSVGNIHRLSGREAAIDFTGLRAIEAVCPLPLVIHGASGVRGEDFPALRRSRVGKANFGTALRRAFGETLRRECAARPQEFDRLKLFAAPSDAVERAAYRCICNVRRGEGEAI